MLSLYYTRLSGGIEAVSVEYNTNGQIPTFDQGVVYKFTTESFDQLISNQSTTYRLVEVDCDIFETGDGDIIVGSVRATTSIPYAENTAAGLRPTARYVLSSNSS